MAAVRSINRENVYINQNFVIRVQNVPEKTSFLVGAGKYHTIVGEELKIKHFKTVLERGLQHYTFKLRNRLIIKFHSK